MANGICVFAENFDGALEPITAELITAARQISETTKEPIYALAITVEGQDVEEQILSLGVDRVYVVRTKKDTYLMDDAVSEVVAQMLKEIDPSSVLIGATPAGRSIFSRVAVKLNCGLTADCTELKVLTWADGSFYIGQNKPSFGENVFVTIVTREGHKPQMMTLRQGVYPPCEPVSDPSRDVVCLDIPFPASGVEVLEVTEPESDTDSILGADVVVVGGRGALEDENFELLTAFADQIGAAIGGTRPMVDSGMIPFEHQIGQTGSTIRPKICISFGVSGAIQHTEGIKDTKLFVAVNTDENAAIFNYADYGITADMKDVISAFLGQV